MYRYFIQTYLMDRYFIRQVFYTDIHFWTGILLYRYFIQTYLMDRYFMIQVFYYTGIYYTDFLYRLTWWTGTWWTPRSQRIPERGNMNSQFPSPHTSGWCSDGTTSVRQWPHAWRSYGQTHGPTGPSLTQLSRPPIEISEN